MGWSVLNFLYQLDIFLLEICFIYALKLGTRGQLLIHLGQVGVRNQQNLYSRIPTTDVAKLLQYSGSRVEHGDGFSS